MWDLIIYYASVVLEHMLFWCGASQVLLYFAVFFVIRSGSFGDEVSTVLGGGLVPGLFQFSICSDMPVT